MSKSIFNSYIFRKYLDIFRSKGLTNREARLLHSNAGKFKAGRQVFSRSLTSLHYSHKFGDFTTSRGYLINQQTSTASTTAPTSPPQPLTTTVTMPILPNHRLLARAFHRLPPKPLTTITTTTKTTSTTRSLSTTPTPSSKTDNSTTSSNWKGRQPNEHVVRTSDSHNVQKDASQAGFGERAKGEESASGAVSEKGGKGASEKVKEEHPEAPPGPVLGMNDERGGKGH